MVELREVLVVDEGVTGLLVLVCCCGIELLVVVDAAVQLASQVLVQILPYTRSMDTWRHLHCSCLEASAPETLVELPDCS